jgi:5-(aminomethyl)-3-furanmethanol phosphate kinase
MEAVLKIGGSLAGYPNSLAKLCKELAVLAKKYRIVIVPGGAEFADTVRKFDRTYGLSDVVAHKMAVLSTDQYGLFLLDVIPDSYVSYSLDEISSPVKDKLPIFLPSQHLFQEDPLENSWDVTSDTIAAYIASLLHAEKLVLITDVDGIFYEDPKKALGAKLVEKLSAKELQEWNKRTSVDKPLPKMLLEQSIDCYIVNGKYPERIKKILENTKTVCTQITV